MGSPSPMSRVRLREMPPVATHSHPGIAAYREVVTASHEETIMKSRIRPVSCYRSSLVRRRRSVHQAPTKAIAISVDSPPDVVSPCVNPRMAVRAEIAAAISQRRKDVMSERCHLLVNN